MFYTTRRAGLAQRRSSSELLCSHEERETFREEELLRLLDMEEYPEEGRPPSPPPRDFFRL